MRIVKELMKIRCLIGSNLEYDELVVKIIKQVERLKSTPSASATSSSSIDLLESVASSMASLKLDRIDPLANGSAGDGESMEEEEATGTEGGRKRKRRTVIDAYAARWKGDPSLYAECWEVPEPSVESVLDRLNESLFEGEPGDENFQRALNYAIPYMRSYPPEFFLQERKLVRIPVGVV